MSTSSLSQIHTDTGSFWLHWLFTESNQERECSWYHTQPRLIRCTLSPLIAFITFLYSGPLTGLLQYQNITLKSMPCRGAFWGSRLPSYRPTPCNMVNLTTQNTLQSLGFQLRLKAQIRSRTRLRYPVTCSHAKHAISGRFRIRSRPDVHTESESVPILPHYGNNTKQIYFNVPMTMSK